MSIFNFIPSYTSDVTDEARTRGTPLGDGYTQRMPEGLNPVLRKWRLVFSALKDSDFSAIRTFMRLRAGADPFDWTPPAPDNVKGRWLNTSPKGAFSNFNNGSLTLEFQEQPRQVLDSISGSLNLGTVARGNPVVATLTAKDATAIVITDWSCDASELGVKDDTGLIWPISSLSWSNGVVIFTATCPLGATVGARTLVLSINGVVLAVTPSGLPITVT